MPYPHDLRSPVNPWNLKDYTGICDRCGFKYWLSALRPQQQWAGFGLINLNLLVCPRCLDVPNENLRQILIGADSVPPRGPRPYFYRQQNEGGAAPPTNLREFLFDGEAPATLPPLPPIALAFTIQPVQTAPGSFALDPVIVAGPDRTFTGNVEIAFAVNPHKAVIEGTLTVAAVAGIASFDDLLIGAFGDGYVLRASASGYDGTALSAAFRMTA